MNASEALYGFAGWLTGRDEVIVMSARDNAAPAGEAVAEFIKVNGLPDVRDGWEKGLTHPPAKRVLGKPENSTPPVAQQTRPEISFITKIGVIVAGVCSTDEIFNGIMDKINAVVANHQAGA